MEKMILVLVLVLSPALVWSKDFGGIMAENSDYQVWFDLQYYDRGMTPDDGTPYHFYFHYKNKKTGKIRKIPFDFGDADRFHIEKLILHGPYLSVFEKIMFADRETGFLHGYDLKKQKDTGNLQAYEIETEQAAFSPDEKYLIFASFQGVGMDLDYGLTSQLELIEMNDKGWKHYFLNKREHGSDSGKLVGVDLPRSTGKKPENFYMISNPLWQADSQKAFFVVGEDLYFRKPKKQDMFEPPLTPSYGMVELDISKGADQFVLKETSLEDSAFPAQDTGEYGGPPYRVTLSWDNGHIKIQ